MEKYRHLLLDVTLPVVVVLGVGLVTYALTGGEEEYGKVSINDVNGEVEETGNGENMAGEDSGTFHMMNDQTEIMMDKLDDIIEKFQKQSTHINQEASNINVRLESISDEPPLWAKKLLDGVVSISSELELIKQQRNTCSKCQEKGNPQSSATCEKIELDNDANIPTPIKTISDWLQRMENALKDICNDNMTNHKTTLTNSPPKATKNQSLINENNTINIPGSAPANSLDWSIMQRGCGALIMYINNLRNQPNVPRYRRISTANSSFKSQVAPLLGHEKILHALGFQKKGSQFEWTWEFSNDNSATDSSEGNSNSSSNSNGRANPSMPGTPSVKIILSEAVKHLEALKVGEVAFKASLINSRQLYPYPNPNLDSSAGTPRSKDNDKEQPTKHTPVTTPSISKSPSEKELLNYDEIYQSKSHVSSPSPPSLVVTPSRDDEATASSKTEGGPEADSYPSLINRNGTTGAVKGKGVNSMSPSLPLAFDDIFKSVKATSAGTPQPTATAPGHQAAPADPSSPAPALIPANSPVRSPIPMSTTDYVCSMPPPNGS